MKEYTLKEYLKASPSQRKEMESEVKEDIEKEKLDSETPGQSFYRIASEPAFKQLVQEYRDNWKTFSIKVPLDVEIYLSEKHEYELDFDIFPETDIIVDSKTMPVLAKEHLKQHEEFLSFEKRRKEILDKMILFMNPTGMEQKNIINNLFKVL